MDVQAQVTLESADEAFVDRLQELYVLFLVLIRRVRIVSTLQRGPGSLRE